MIIRTSQDAALVSCCECGPPDCAEPCRECESITGIGYLYGFVNGNLPPAQWYQMLYKNLRQEYANGGRWFTYEWNTIIEVRLGGKLVSVPMVRTDSNGGPSTFAQPITNTYTGGVTFADAVTEMETIMETALDWGDATMAKGSDCAPSRSEYYSEFTAGGNRPHDFSLTFVRYRLGVPEGFSTESAPRSVFDVQWDEVFFPKEWSEWKTRKDAFDQAVAIHAAWEAAEPETRGDEPDVPDDPGEAPSPAPTLVASRSWSWTGSMENPWSEWLEIPMPESPGETRIVNMMVVCFHDSKRGVKPTAHGELHELTEPGI